MPGLIFAFLMTLISLGAVVLIVMLGLQAERRKAKANQETLFKLLDSGVYDHRLIRPRKRGHALLGWGIVFAATGLGVLTGLAGNQDPSVLRNALPGAMVPMFIGIGMIIFWVIVRKVSSGTEENDEPIVFEKREGAPPEPPAAVV